MHLTITPLRILAKRVEYQQGPLPKWPLPRGKWVSTEVDAFMAALDDLDRALDESLEMTQRMKRRINELRSATAEGRPLREIVPEEKTPLLVQLLTESTNLLHAYGNRVRRTEARALHGQGMTMDEIAQLFGVTRQRVSALLRET
jgi:DNA-directed RNA polymerase sigma subunit (sigma70/sigma32)